MVNQGFSDADRRGQQMQQQMVEMAAREGIRILGPNTLGVINSFAGFTTSFMPVTKQRVGVGLICQSGIHFVGPNTTEVQMQFESKNRIMIYPTLELATQALSWLRDRYKIITRDERGFV